MVEKFRPTTEFTRQRSLPIITERVDGVNVGKITLRVEPLNFFQSTEAFDTLLNSLNGHNHSNEQLRKNLVFHLIHNAATTKNPITHERAVSSYFTYDPNSELVIIEWGTIDLKSGDAKLHTFLNQSINFTERIKRGMRISSGHLAKLKKTKGYIALFDNLFSQKPRSEISPQLKKTINTLHLNGIIPITADGFVQLPVF